MILRSHLDASGVNVERGLEFPVQCWRILSRVTCPDCSFVERIALVTVTLRELGVLRVSIHAWPTRTLSTNALSTFALLILLVPTPYLIIRFPLLRIRQHFPRFVA